MKFDFLTDFLKKFSNIKFSENPSTGSVVVPCGSTEIGQSVTITAQQQFYFRVRVQFIPKLAYQLKTPIHLLEYLKK
jgi:hypothetical protein